MIDLKIGDVIRHLKRGSSYEVLGHGVENAIDLLDGRMVKRHLTNGIILPVMQQVTSHLHAGSVGVIYYRALVSKPGEPWLFMRPVSEFTSDRFEKVPQ